MAKSEDGPKATRESPVMLELLQLDKGSAVALVGHPIHVMMVHFPIAFVIATFGVDLFYSVVWRSLLGEGRPLVGGLHLLGLALRPALLVPANFCWCLVSGCLRRAGRTLWPQ